MARFDVYRDARGGASRPHLLDVQTSYLSELRTRVVIPLVPLARFAKPMARLNPVMIVDGERYVLATSEIVSVDRRMLGTYVGSLDEHHDEITAAIDFLLQGF